MVDNNLGNLNGISICANVEDKTIERILLTGDYDYIDAIRALNNKIITFFIDKMPLSNRFFESSNKLNDDMINEIMYHIDIAIDRYFINKDSSNNKLLSNPQFKYFFINIIKNNNIVSYYLIEKDLFSMIDINNREYLLKCWTLLDFDDFYNAHYDELDIAMNNKLNLIREEKKLPMKDKLLDSIKVNDLYYYLVENTTDEG